jgi:autotransporter-associated beta strand protein
MGAANVLPASATLLVGQNDTNIASLNLNGFDQTTSRLYSNPVNFGANTPGKSITSATPATLTANQTADGIYASVFTGAVSLTKAGAASLTLRGASTHTGTTNVTAGILSVENVSGSATGTGPVVVGAAGTLIGNGSMAGALAVEGVISPGAGLATLTAGTATLKPTSVYTCEINSATLGSDTLAVKGNLVIEAGATLNLADLGSVTLASGSKFVLATYIGSRTGTFTGMADGATVTVGANAYTLNYQDTANGKGAVTLAISAPYASWASSYGLNLLTTGAPGADPDGDGVLNILEYATNANPNDPTSRGRVYGKVHNLGGSDVLTLTIAVRSGATFAAAAETQTATKDGVTYIVEASESLSTWNEVVTKLNAAESADVQAVLPLPVLESGWEWHSFRTDGATTTEILDFIRLRVQQ